MSMMKRTFLAFLLLIGISVSVLGIEAWRSTQMQPVSEAGLPPGAIPIYLDGKLTAHFLPADLEQLNLASFVDAEEGKTQDGWLLRDVLALFLPPVILDSGTRIQVTSSSREKTAELTWDEVALAENMVMFDLSGRGTLKLVAKQGKLAARDEWVQDVDKIEVFLP